jgi:glycosyltransferase involved in cell wall biosynthesis
MRIAIVNLTGGVMSGGYKKYLKNVLPRLVSSKDIESVLCISPNSLHVETWFERICKVKFLNCAFLNFPKIDFYSTMKNELKLFSPDLIYIPVARYFKFGNVPIVNMIQNILPFLARNINGLSLYEAFRLNIQRLESIRAIKRANHIIATSNFVKDFLTKKLEISDKKVSLIYFGRDLFTKDLEGRPSPILGLERGFLFTAGSLECYRGIEDIIGAVEILKNDFPELKFVIAGKPRSGSTKYYKKLLQLVDSYGLDKNIIWAGHLNQDALTWCYQNCAAFVCTSRMETFGMVMVEAMSNGCLCIAAQNPPLPEIFMDCACYYVPKNARSLADSIQRVLNWHEREKKEMIDKAKKRAEYFCWDKCAKGLMDEFKVLVEKKQNKPIV